jgi:hypothetical protein
VVQPVQRVELPAVPVAETTVAVAAADVTVAVVAAVTAGRTRASSSSA